MDKLGLIAGGGGLPAEIADHCQRVGRPFFVIRLKGFAGVEVAGFPGADVGLAELGKCIRLLKREGCSSVCLAGTVSRPDFSTLIPDGRGLLALPGAIRAARQGDDALLRFLVGEFEKEGLLVEGAHEVTDDLTLPAGPLGAHAAGEAHMADVIRAMEVARAIGQQDIGQAAVVCRGLVLGVEAQEGTAALLQRVAGLPQALRGGAGARAGVLAKAPKPIQEVRVDMPVIGPETIAAAARAGLAGVVGEADRLLVLDRAATIAAADTLGLFILGLEPDPT
ncbi:MAG: DUF1009 domain-containing protein [Phenylobacterium sp.]|nr:MAG: DUF1009 domain-containing protein [Phenylobacterium sp.]